MFVLCPHCQFLVAVDPASDEPPLRCPRCDNPQSAAPEPATIVDAPATPIAAEGDAEPSATDSAPLQPTAAAAPDLAPAPSPPCAEAIAEEALRDDPSPPLAQPHSAPSGSATDPIATDAMPAAARRRLSEGWIIAALSVLLALQLLLANRVSLAGDARWRPALAQLCSVVGCTLPPWREPAAFTLLDRNVAPAPRLPGVLRVTGRFRNDARWPQPWPQLLLTLSDADGRIAGERVFAPADYRQAAAANTLVARGQIATFRINVIEPAPDIVAFTFQLR